MNPAWLQVVGAFASIGLLIGTYVYLSGKLTGQHEAARQAQEKAIDEFRASVEARLSKLSDGQLTLERQHDGLERRFSAMTGIANGIKYREEET